MEASHFRFFQNKTCEFFPCHTGADPDDFNCLFCYCPLFALGRRCGGNFHYTEGGCKDCSGCLVPHKTENYDRVLEKLKLVADMVSE